MTRAFEKYNAMKLQRHEQHKVLFHGVSSVMKVDEYEGTCFGPLSTTTDICVARSFAGKEGMILVIEPQSDDEGSFRPMDLSKLSDFTDECEVLCFNLKFRIQKVIKASDFDASFLSYYAEFGLQQQCANTLTSAPFDALIDNNNPKNIKRDMDIYSAADVRKKVLVM